MFIEDNRLSLTEHIWVRIHRPRSVAK